MVFYTTTFVGDDYAGKSFGPFIFIKPQYKDDVGLLEHEKIHVQQFWRHFPIFGLLYRVFKHRRMCFEVEAYAEQSKHYTDDRIPKFAQLISEKYNLGITPEIAERAIRDKLAE